MAREALSEHIPAVAPAVSVPPQEARADIPADVLMTARIVALQRTAGNAAVARHISRGRTPRAILRQTQGPPAQPPVQAILIDANVLDQVNRGNRAAAHALKRLSASGSLYISQQAYNEAVTDPAFRRTATANRLLLDELGIKVAPPGDMGVRVDVYATRAGLRHIPMSEKDVMTTAQAKAINAKVWSFDDTFAKSHSMVKKTFGVDVAKESYELPFIENRQDYRVGRRLLGLKPVEISFSGAVSETAAETKSPGASASPTAKTTGATHPTGPSARPRTFNKPIKGKMITAGKVTGKLGGTILLGFILAKIRAHFEERFIRQQIDSLQPHVRSVLQALLPVGIARAIHEPNATVYANVAYHITWLNWVVEGEREYAYPAVLKDDLRISLDFEPYEGELRSGRERVEGFGAEMIMMHEDWTDVGVSFPLEDLIEEFAPGQLDGYLEGRAQARESRARRIEEEQRPLSHVTSVPREAPATTAPRGRQRP
jgi:hypothetical protein